MNAYELADDLENSNGLQYITKVGLVSLSAQTLRQQADRIAELEKEKQNHKYDPDTGEPLIDGYPLFSGLPLPQIKELSDKEITQVFDECYPNNGDGDVVTLIDFARAILKKASKK
jgi:hypothetical protein